MRKGEPPALSFRKAVILLGAIAALGSLSTQLLVPALPSIASDLQIGVRSAQLVVGVFLVGLGGGQLLVGPLADRMARRHLLLLGLALFGAGCLLATYAGNLETLLAARLLQALGSAAGLVTARVLINTMVPPNRAVAAQASLMSIVLISPAVAPVLGGLLTELFGWRTIMALLCGAGTIAALVVARQLPPSAPRPRDATRVALPRAYAAILGNWRFLTATTAMGFGSAVLYVFLGATPFLLEEGYGLSPRETGMCLLLVASASIAGTRVVALVQRRLDPLRAGTALGVFAVLLLGMASWEGQPALVLFLIPCVLLGLTAGFIGPTAMAHILASKPGLEGTATSLAGALQMTVSALMAWLLGSFAAQSPWFLATALLPLSCTAAIAARVLGRLPR